MINSTPPSQQIIHLGMHAIKRLHITRSRNQVTPPPSLHPTRPIAPPQSLSGFAIKEHSADQDLSSRCGVVPHAAATVPVVTVGEDKLVPDPEKMCFVISPPRQLQQLQQLP